MITWFFVVSISTYCAIGGHPPPPVVVTGFPSHAACERVRLATAPTAAPCEHEVTAR